MPTARTNGIDTYYEEVGEGPPVVFLHGAESDHRIWAAQTRPLADEYRLVLYDLRGHGGTGGSDREVYSMELYADDLRALVEALALDRPVVCGLSLGGMVAQTYADRYPGALSGLVTIGSRTPELFSRTEWLLYRGVPTAMLALSRVVDIDRLRAGLQRVGERVYGEEAGGDLDEAERVQRAHAADYPETDAAESRKTMGALASFGETAVDHAAIAVPSLHLYGELEPDSAAAHAEYVASEVPGGDARGIPGAGHNSHVDEPAFVVDALREFLDERVHGGRGASDVGE